MENDMTEVYKTKTARLKRLQWLLTRELARLEESRGDIEIFTSEISALKAEILTLHMDGES